MEQQNNAWANILKGKVAVVTGAVCGVGELWQLDWRRAEQILQASISVQP
ncbi:hypothetical protein [Edaphobacter aggregans]|nr:hypothetical protein [Edaphobacter aggregans]